MMHQVINAYLTQGGGTPAAQSIAVLPLVSVAAVATEDYTSSTISGITPDAALVVGSTHQTSNDPGATGDAAFSFGSIVGSSANCVSVISRTGQSTTDVLRTGLSSGPIHAYSGVGVGVNSTAGSTISGGVSITYSQGAGGRRGMAMVFTEAQAKNGVISLGTGTSAISVSGVGFQPDVVFLYGHGDDFAAGATQLFQYTFGAATSDGTQRSASGAELDNQGAGAPFQAILTDAGAQAKQAGSTIHKMTVGGFNSDGFTVTPNVSQGSDELAYLALKSTTGKGVKIVDFTTPTSTGNFSVTGVGFTPQAAVVILTNLEAVDSAAASASDLQGGFAVSFIADVGYSMSSRIDSGADTTSTATTCRNVALLGPSATATDAFIASLVSWDSDGATFNATAVQANGKKGFIVFFEEE